MRYITRFIRIEDSPEMLDIIPLPNDMIRVAWGEDGDRGIADVVESEFMGLMCLYGKTFGTTSRMGCRGMMITPKGNKIYNKTDTNIIEFFGEKDITLPISTETLLMLADKVRRIRYEDSFWFRLKCAFQPNRYY